MANSAAELVSGAARLGRGAGLMLRQRRLFLLGALPPLITSALYLALLIFLSLRAEAIAGWLSPFAEDWPAATRAAFRLLLGITTFDLAVLVLVIPFTALTLAIGSPLYDKISEAVERELGLIAAADTERGLAGAWRGMRQSITLILTAALGGLCLLGLGYVPVVGQVAAPVVSILFGSWMLCLELLGSTFDRHGLRRLADRRAAMRRRPWRVLGFSVPAFVLLAVPLAALVVFPVATAGATLLAQDLLPDQSRDGGGPVLPRGRKAGTESK